MSATPEHSVSPALFDVIAEYVEQLKSGTALSGKVVPQTSPIITFTENAFAQIFENEVGTEITAFDFKAKQRATALRYAKKADLSKEVVALISLYEQFCDVREDVLGAGYGGQASVLEDFHCKLVVRLLKRLRALAKARKDSVLLAKVAAALTSFEQTVNSYDWSSV